MWVVHARDLGPPRETLASTALTTDVDLVLGGLGEPEAEAARGADGNMLCGCDRRGHVAGDPFVEVLVAPSSAAWRRGPGDYGQVIYVTTDGGTTAPPDGIVRNAAMLRVEVHPRTES